MTHRFLHWLTELSGASLSTRTLALALGHAAAATTVYSTLYYDVPVGGAMAEWIPTFVVSAAALLVVLTGLSACWRLADRAWRRRFPPIRGTARWLTGAALVVGLGVAGALPEQGGGLVWIVGCIFLGTLGALTVLARLPWGATTDDHVLPDALAATWTGVCILETLFHTLSGSFFRWAAIGGLMTTMADEVVAFVFGPAVWVTVAIAAAYLAGVVALSATFRRWPTPDFLGAKGRLTFGLVLVVAGTGSAAFANTGDLLRRVHHAHPTVADLAGTLAPAPPIPDLAANGAHPTEQRPAAAKNLLIIYVDTLSRRHLGTYGYDRNVSPNIDALAAESTRFTAARTNASHTDLATVALFYGIFPYLNARKEDDYRVGHGGRALHLLAGDAGFQTGIFSGDWEQGSRGYAPLFPGSCDAYMDAHTAGDPQEIQDWAGLREDHVVDAFLSWYRPLHDGDRPFVGYVKFIRPHSPYYTPPDWTGPFQPAAPTWSFLDYHPSPARAVQVLNRYDNAVYWTDQQIGRLVADLKQSGAWEDTAIVLLADHGEAWGEHVLFTHSMQHFEEFVEIPLLVRVPGRAPRDDGRWASTVDVAPTALSLLGLPPASFHQGGDLTDPDYAPDSYFALSNIAANLATLQRGRWKYTRDLYTGEQWLFDMESDPAERQNLAWDAPEATTLREALDDRLSKQLGHIQALRTSTPAAP